MGILTMQSHGKSPPWSTKPLPNAPGKVGLPQEIGSWVVHRHLQQTALLLEPGRLDHILLNLSPWQTQAFDHKGRCIASYALPLQLHQATIYTHGPTLTVTGAGSTVTPPEKIPPSEDSFQNICKCKSMMDCWRSWQKSSSREWQWLSAMVHIRTNWEQHGPSKAKWWRTKCRELDVHPDTHKIKVPIVASCLASWGIFSSLYQITIQYGITMGKVVVAWNSLLAL